jgi:hypothetical protein
VPALRTLPVPLVVALLVAGCLAALGLILLLYDIANLSLRLRFTDEYLGRFDRFVKAWSAGLFDPGEYDWLLRRSPKMQAELGLGGMADYKPAGSLSYLTGYAILVNTLPEIVEGTAHPDVVRRTGETLVRHAGLLQDTTKKKAAHLLNPVQWVLHGLDVPAGLLVTIGLLNSTRGESPILRLLTLVGLVVGILAEWNGATAFLRSLKLIP